MALSKVNWSKSHKLTYIYIYFAICTSAHKQNSYAYTLELVFAVSLAVVYSDDG